MDHTRKKIHKKRTPIFYPTTLIILTTASDDKWLTTYY